MSELLSVELAECEGDLFSNVIQVEFVDGCARRVSANRAFGECVIRVLSAKRWDCDNGFQCGTLSRVPL